MAVTTGIISDDLIVAIAIRTLLNMTAEKTGAAIPYCRNHLILMEAHLMIFDEIVPVCI